MKKNKKAIVLIYVLFMVTISVIFATILLNNNSYLFNVSDLFEVDSKLLSNIDSDAYTSVQINSEKNTDGSGFVDNISCPGPASVTMSGTTNTATIGTTLVYSGSIYCEGNYLGDSVKLYFNTGITDIVEAEYKGFILALSGGSGATDFGDTDNTFIDFSAYNYFVSDGIDDDFDSDNYMVTSTGNTSTGTYYSSGYQDDDVFARKHFYGFISPDFGYKKVFWNTSSTLKMIDENTNNNDNLNTKIGNVTSGYLYFDVDSDFDIKLLKFDKGVYDETKELKVLQSLNGALSASIGYLQNNAGTLDLSETITGNEYTFDFQNNDYALFIKSVGTGSLLYTISGFSSTGTGIYINPIDDSATDSVRYLGNEILIDSSGKHISKETELFFKK
ncbi:MAG: hypothetical protein PHS49_00805 [Candidatus Gracilibacteria bacterium]|nr:hypothetical protein [Candidatus Gracilibacteria bacterium]